MIIESHNTIFCWMFLSSQAVVGEVWFSCATHVEEIGGPRVHRPIMNNPISKMLKVWHSNKCMLACAIPKWLLTVCHIGVLILFCRFYFSLGVCHLYFSNIQVRFTVMNMNCTAAGTENIQVTLFPCLPFFLPHVHVHNQVKQLVCCVCVCTRTRKNGASWQWRTWRTAWLVLRGVHVLRKWGRWRRNGRFSRQPYAFFASLATAPLSCTHESRCGLHGVVAAFWLPVFASIFAPVS